MHEDNFVDDACDVISQVFANAHQKTVQKIEKEGRPLEQIEKYLDSVIKNDYTLVRQILRVCFSAYTNNPINLAVLAPTSEGKTYATVKVTNLFPPEDVIAVARLSPTALIHSNGILVDENGNEISEKLDQLFFEILHARKARDKELTTQLESESTELKKNAKNLVDLSNKILLFLDTPNSATYEMLKPLLSHDKYELLYKTTTTDGSLKVKETVIRGWPAAIVCSAKNEAQNEVWPEVVSRFFMTSPNSNVKKYKDANKFSADVLGVPTWANSIYTDDEAKKYAIFFISKIKESISKSCEEGQNPIFNPFRHKIADLLPNSQGIDMRHFKRIMAFCNIETLLKASKNMKIEFISNNKQRSVSVITSLQNIHDATKILGEISTLSPDKVKFFENVFKPCMAGKLDEYTGEKNDTGLTSKELAEMYTEVFKKPITPKKILENYLRPLVDEGVLESFPNPEWVTQHLYRLGSDITVHNLKDLKSKLIESIEYPVSYVWLGVAKLGRASIKSGKLTRLFDKDGTVNYIAFKKKIPSIFS
jgi:hypothetical protein